jgi:ABC-2 type transport system ATP-binding protein
MATAIAFRSVTKRFPNGALGLADASWYIAEGSQTCLLGPSGSGKTTAVRILEAALKPTGGSVLLLGVPIDSPDYRKVRRRLGIVPQLPGVYQDLTAGEYMALAAGLYDQRPERVEEALDLTEYLHTRMTHLSSAFQRRLALAAALVADPDVLLLDEPTAGLDPVAARDLHRYLRQVMPGRTTLLCTNSEAEAESLCQEVISLRAGRVVAQGTWEELRRRAKARLRVAARQGPERLVAELGQLGYKAEADGTSVLVELTELQEEAPVILRRLIDAQVDVYECAPVRPTVEGVFQEGTDRREAGAGTAVGWEPLREGPR